MFLKHRLSGLGPKTRRGCEYRRCLKGCSRLRGNAQEACSRRCLEEYWRCIFSDMTQIASETSMSPRALLVALKAAFDVQFDATMRRTAHKIESEELRRSRE